MTLLCIKHHVEMPTIQRPLRGTAPLHRCPICTAEFQAAIKKAMQGRGKYATRLIHQRVLPPVIMSERWPS